MVSILHIAYPASASRFWNLAGPRARGCATLLARGTMSDTLTPAERSERMSRVKGRDTGPEREVRKVLRSLGYRYRLCVKGLAGRPDIVFKARRRVIFVHGCFWHRHDGCKLARLPKSRVDFWTSKLAGNSDRDKMNMDKLHEDGWKVLIIWECEITDRKKITDRIESFMAESLT